MTNHKGATESPAVGAPAAVASATTCAAQIAYADRVVLNKADLVESEADLDALRRIVRSLNGLAELRCCVVPLYDAAASATASPG